MPHFHDFNPWAAKLVYIPSIAEATSLNYEDRVFAQWGEKVDAYVLPQPSGYHSLGIRFGEEPMNYLSPYIEPEKAAALLAKYSNTGA